MRDFRSKSVNKDLLKTLKKQSDALDVLKDHFSPESEEKRFEKLRSVFVKAFTGVGLLVSLILGGGELLVFLYEKYNTREMADKYSEVAKEIYYTENNAEVSLKFLEKALEMRENYSKYRYLKGYIESMNAVRNIINLDRPYTKAELNETHMALAQSMLLRQLEPALPESYILKGQIYMALDENKKALSELTAALKIDSKNDFAYVRLATVQYNVKDADAALSSIEKALAINSQSKWAWLWKGIILNDLKGDSKGNQECVDKAIAIDPRFDLAYYNKAWTFLKARPRNFEKAKENFEIALKIRPDYKEAFYGLAMVYGYQDKYEIARLYLEKALEIDDKFLTAHKWLGIVFDEMSDFEQAIASYSRALELNPSDGKLFMRRARTFLKMGELNKSLSDLQFSLEVDPNSYRTLYYLGMVYLQINSYEKAYKNFSKSIEIRPTFANAYSERALACERLKKFDEALTNHNKSIEVNKHKPVNYIMARAKYFLRRNQLEECYKDIDQVIKLSPHSADAWKMKSIIDLSKKNTQAARKSFQTYLEKNPDSLETFEAFTESQKNAITFDESKAKSSPNHFKKDNNSQIIQDLRTGKYHDIKNVSPKQKSKIKNSIHLKKIEFRKRILRR